MPSWLTGQTGELAGVAGKAALMYATAVVGLSGSGRRSGDFGSADWLIVNWGWGLAVCFGVYVAGGVTGALPERCSC